MTQSLLATYIEGEKKHRQLIRLLKKASKSGDGQLCLKQI